MIEIAITDDHLIVIEGIKTMLKSNKEIVISQFFTTVTATIQELENTIQVLLLDINLPDGNGILACKTLLEKFPHLKIIALTNFEDTAFVKQMLKNGSRGYLLKNTDKLELITAIKTVLNDELYLPAKIEKFY